MVINRNKHNLFTARPDLSVYTTGATTSPMKVSSTSGSTVVVSKGGGSGLTEELATKLNSIEEGAQVNQNAYSKVTSGNSSIEATNPTDVLQISTDDNIKVTLQNGIIKLEYIGPDNLWYKDANGNLWTDANVYSTKEISAYGFQGGETGSGARYLYELNDVSSDVETPSNGNILRYDSNLNLWTLFDAKNLEVDLTPVYDRITSLEQNDIILNNLFDFVDGKIRANFDFYSLGEISAYGYNDGEAGSGARYLYELNDVTPNAENPSNGNILRYDALTKRWELFDPSNLEVDLTPIYNRISGLEGDVETTNQNVTSNTNRISALEKNDVIANNLFDFVDGKIQANYDFYGVGEISAYGFKEGESGGGSSYLHELKDVTLTSLSNGQLLQWDGATWVNVDKTTVGISQEQLNEQLAAKVNRTIKVIAGNGLTGGGELTSDVTLSLPTIGNEDSYYKVTTDKYGRIVSGRTNLTIDDIDDLSTSLESKLDKSVFYSLFTINKDESGNIVSIQANADFYSVGEVSAYGLKEGGDTPSGGMDVALMWKLLAGDTKEQINITHLTSALTDYASKSWVENKGYLTLHQSLDGYATEQWVLDKAYITSSALNGYATQKWVEDKGYAVATDISNNYATKAALNTLSSSVNSLRTDFDNLNALLNDDVTGKINTWHEVVDFLDEYSGSQDLATILSTMNANIASRLEKTKFAEYFATEMAKWFVKDDANKGIKPVNYYGLYSDTYVSAKGVSKGASGGGGGTSYDRLDSWAEYTSAKAGYVLSALLGYDLHTRVNNLANAGYITASALSGYAKLSDIPTSLPASDVYSWAKAASKPSYAFSEITNKPTTLGGYGITDAYTATTIDGKLSGYLPLSGGTLNNDRLKINSIKGQVSVSLYINDKAKTDIGWDSTNGSYIYDRDSGSQISIKSDGNAYLYKNGFNKLIHSGNYTSYKPSYAFSEITNKPTTLDGYGITDFVVKITNASIDNCVTKSGIYRWTNVAAPSLPDTAGYGNSITINGGGDTYLQIYGSYSDVKGCGLFWRGAVSSNTTKAWKRILDSSNYTDYTYSQTTIDSKLSGYLPLSGGTIDSGSNRNALTINSSDGSGPLFGLNVYDVNRVMFGVAPTASYGAFWSYIDGNVAILLGTNGKVYIANEVNAFSDRKEIIHGGNIGSYALKTDGSNLMTGYVAWNNGSEGNDIADWNTIRGNGLKIISSRTNTSNAPTTYATALHIKGRYGFQIASEGGDTDKLFFKNISREDRTWKRIAFTDSNVASADYAKKSGALDALVRDLPADTRGSLDNSYALYTGGWANSKLGYASIYGTYIDLSGYSTWYHRLAFCTTGEIEHFMGINTTTLSKVGSLAYLTSNVASATKLRTARKIWGQSFDGTGDVSGYLTGVDFIKSDATNGYFIGNRTAGLNGVTDGGLLLWSYGNTPISFYTNASSRMKITGGGNVLIDTTEDIGFKFVVNGYSKLASIFLEYTDEINRYGGNLYLQHRGHGGSQGATKTGNIVMCDNGGNVGIGTTSPTEKLHVAGNISIAGNIVGDYASIVNREYNPYVKLSEGAYTVYMQMSDGTIYLGSTMVKSLSVDREGNVSTNGNIVATGSVTAKSSSDYRLKCEFDYGVDYQERLLSLGKVCDFNYTSHAQEREFAFADDKRHTSVIWQDARKANITGFCSVEEDGYGTINPLSSDLIFTMVGAIQQGIAKTEKIEDRVVRLEKENRELKEKINLLEGGRYGC